MTESSLEELFPDQPLINERFEDHVVTIRLGAGEGNGFSFHVECKAGDKDHSICVPQECQVETMLKYDGVDVIKAAGNIDFKVNAKIDWSDPEEPWVEVEP